MGTLYLGGLATENHSISPCLGSFGRLLGSTICSFRSDRALDFSSRSKSSGSTRFWIRANINSQVLSISIRKQGFVRIRIRNFDFRACDFSNRALDFFESIEIVRIDPVLDPHGDQTTGIEHTYPHARFRANPDPESRFSSHSKNRAKIEPVDRSIFSSRSKSSE